MIMKIILTKIIIRQTKKLKKKLPAEGYGLVELKVFVKNQI